MSEQQSPSCSRRYSATSMSVDSAATETPMFHPEAEEEDRQNVQKIITALLHYRKYAYARVNKTENYLKSLPKRHQHMLAKYSSHLSNVRDCIDVNQSVIKQMLSGNIPCTGGESTITQQDNDGHAIKIRHQDMENAQSTLKLIARDWSEAGAEERRQSYKPIIDAIEEFFKPDEFELGQIKILVPGAGLGRLCYELACRGYECEGNEFSYFMLIASNFVLNKCSERNKYTLYPWVHQYGNNLHMADQVTGISFPDVCPKKNPPKTGISMAAGDFLEVYKEPNLYDCVATCFFIDCGNNIIDFIETIYRILVPGGIWVNLGPLLYHYSDIPGENSIEPTYENIMLIIEMAGFEIVRNEPGVRTKYAQNPQSMLKSEYESLFWICRKPLTANDLDEVDDNTNENNGFAEATTNNQQQQQTAYRNGFDTYTH